MKRIVSLFAIPVLSYALLYCTKPSITTTEDEPKKGTVNKVGEEVTMRARLIAVSIERVILKNEQGTYIKAYYDLPRRPRIRRLKKNRSYDFVLTIRTVLFTGEVVYDFVSAH
jgi:hypothetical protein